MGSLIRAGAVPATMKPFRRNRSFGFRGRFSFLQRLFARAMRKSITGRNFEQVGGLHFRLPAHLGKALALTASFTAGRNLMSMASFSASGNRPVA